MADKEQFEAALQDLLRTALENDVDPRGAWKYRPDSPGSDWEVMVFEIQQDRQADQKPDTHD